MSKEKPVSPPLADHFKLNSKQCLKSKVGKEDMEKISYASTIGNLMYAKVCTRQDIDHVAGVVTHYLSNPSKVHLILVKWIFKYLRQLSYYVCNLVAINQYQKGSQMLIWQVILILRSLHRVI